jgi:hypothetical protein
LFNIVVAPVHTFAIPVIGAARFIVSGMVALHPLGKVYTILTAPAATAVITPDNAPAVAKAVLLLLHVPPKSGSVNDEVAPMQRLDTPAIADGNGLTAIDFVT